MPLILLLLIFALLFWFLIRSRLPHRDASFLMCHDYAHRGLWNDQRPENSLAAFRAAADAGYGIELDVHLTADGHLVVHHDDSTLRMCGVDVSIKDSPLSALADLRLKGTDEAIPTFDQVLEAVDGRVPLIVELKVVHGDADALARAAYARLLRYKGPWCMESFDPFAVRWFRRHAPRVVRGQLSFAPHKEKTLLLTLRDFVLGTLMVNAISRPDFIAYDHHGDGRFNLPVNLLRRMGALMVCWTVRSPEDMSRLRSRFHLQIFEGFIPTDAPRTR